MDGSQNGTMGKRFAPKKFSLHLFSVSRVTRLGDFSPLGQLLTLGNFFMKIKQLAQVCALLISEVKIVY
jgi:hypothetical protein